MFASFKIAAIAAASATLAVGAGAASAEDFVSNGRTMEVRHGDLDLSRPDQQAVLRARISRAAARVCTTSDLNAYAACRRKAIAHVQPRLNAVIARADSGERYADARPVEARAVVGN